jgi:hypothetical protein
MVTQLRVWADELHYHDPHVAQRAAVHLLCASVMAADETESAEAEEILANESLTGNLELVEWAMLRVTRFLVRAAVGGDGRL